VQHVVRILIFVEDAIDAELVRRALQQYDARMEARYVFGEQEYLSALRSFGPDLILSEYKVSLYGGAFALKMAQEFCPSVPFVFVSDVLADNLTGELLKRGAKAHVSKNQLEQIGPLIQSVLAKSKRPGPARPPVSSRQTKRAGAR